MGLGDKFEVEELVDKQPIFRGEAKPYKTVKSSLLRKFRKVTGDAGESCKGFFDAALSARVMAKEASPYFRWRDRRRR